MHYHRRTMGTRKIFFKKKPLKFSATIFKTQGFKMVNASVKVKAYRRDDGTKVKGHKRTPPDGICTNNLKPKKCKK
ncbi:MAG: hypothetical protein COT46_08140 [Sulfurimonas sp. CG08_land_8_20_14_0_20_36_33]|nr:MAG: hypothetical protein AUJ81_06000 [Helicobacteraceae bacterium CG1_02_36_14]PIP10361.1 MAG: hypothetical protein COX50_06165 [Sulfurimonas sp. CG23_combo_of_CG06-09_8_20_14_all_36_33]PIS24800.1 MAG: hypothetical protein COT46_08140 [Sulfurimonas sp. CG08_land_8_20_14_0_20_36_33]PIU34658.1 MAG: hypothetical protein COT05_06665 [Sulfurimonas sp. CG07_land_8_20_14_0_80_36_56]PIV03968.1 MAG: hypothetical protein COS56_06175 [Sulfurimonas sp. CG03_land_8_20_14_0_80_36_25]PIV36665.1 MAG: hypo